MAQTTICIVTGGFIKPSAYDELAKELRQKGYNVIVPHLAVYGDLTGQTADSQAWKDMADKGVLDDVKVITKELEAVFDEGHEVVIFGHSYGTLPAVASIEGNSVDDRKAKGLKGGIKSYVNLAGFACPARGKNMLGSDSDDDVPVQPYHTLEAGVLYLHDTAKPLFFSDLSVEAQEAAWQHVYRHQSRKSLLYKPQFIEADVKIPMYYIKTLEDQTVNPEYQAMFIQMGGLKAEFELPSGHCPAASMPDKLADIVDTVAKR